MDTGDCPPMYNRPVRVETRVEKPAESMVTSFDALGLLAGGVARTSDRLAQVAEKLPGAKAMDVDVTNVGAVDRLTLPAGWVAGKETNNIGGLGRSQQYTAPGTENVELTLFDRGRRYNSNAAAFKDVLSKPAHDLTAAEQKSLGSILGNYEDTRAFKMSSCKTEDLNGKCVLVIEGTWNVNGHRSHSVLVSPDGTGSTVQEIFYKAPQDQYEKHLPSVQSSMKSIRWK